MGFFKDVYDIIQKIPKGKVMTYGQIAELIGRPGKGRIVGWALHVNKNPDVIPCHRVVNSHGLISSGYAFGGPDAQKNLLEQEGIIFREDGSIDLSVALWRP